MIECLYSFIPEATAVARHFPHIGLRTVKTGLAVALALLFASLRGSPLPIFAAIGAIVAMSRTVGDAFETCRTQFFGILLGAGFGTVFVHVFEGLRWFGTGVGIILLILLCIRLRLQFAVPLACIVFVSVCLSPASEAIGYGANRLLDTTIGLATALAVNVVVKPYNNRARIESLLRHFRESVPAYVDERVLHSRYPDLMPLRAQLDRIHAELTTFEKQKLFRRDGHAEQAAYLRGCEQLAQSVLQELTALCTMDELGRLTPENAAQLSVLGLEAPDGMAAPPRTDADIVAGYHLGNLLTAYAYLADFSASAAPE